MQARHEDVAVELSEAERHLGEGLRSVDHGDDVMFACQGAQILDRQKPAVPMVHIADIAPNLLHRHQLVLREWPEN